MLKVIKRKAREQDAVNPRIDMSLVLSEQKMSWNDRLVPTPTGLPSGNELPASVTVASSGAVSSEDSLKDIIVEGTDHNHDTIRTLSQPKTPSPFYGVNAMDSPTLFPAMDAIFAPAMASSAFSTRHGSFDAEQDCDYNPRPTKQPKMTDALDGPQFSPMVTLLSQEQDEECLKSPLHIFVRKQIEVFTATETELNQPAPGRKRPIQLSQVGIRCIHCKHLPVRERVKRAGSYPNCVQRIYHSVSDFQFDHLPNCNMLPPDVRAEFQALKDEAKNSKRAEKKRAGRPKGSVSTSTAKYYEESARAMGMVDGRNGIFMQRDFHDYTSVDEFPAPLPDLKMEGQKIDDSKKGAVLPVAAAGITLPALKSGAKAEVATKCSAVDGSRDRTSVFPMPLSAPKDSEYLNALHVFCRKNIELFTADEEDIASPAPGRKTRPRLGQIGIRCIHCAKLASKDRVKRSVCYPPTIGAIYHATSNMKFDHFKICPALPPQARDEFEALKTSCVRRGSSNSVSSNSMKLTTSSTSEYYRKSALEKGLIDSDSGIRYKTDSNISRNNHSTEAPRTSTIGKGGKAMCVFTGLSTLALAACHAK
ncbi:hypothetical protein IV203_016644 [Nitzschia inconspicua]|uniref:Uncharacterized protein n=1 Tax=Nitzschia inconspicua TaxID=303405 RepID=A0A9K3PK70_9STRA|nr:hypothetical protein IV203_016644 [Nitzschia inconspicua]